MSDPIDKALDEYLSRNSQVSRRYRELDDAVVPPQLDQAVLAQARAAVADRQPWRMDGHLDGQADERTDELERLRQRRKRLMRWSVPAGLAASAVFVVSIVMQSGVQHEVGSLPQQPASAPAVVRESGDRSSDKEEGLVVLTQPPVQPHAQPPAPMIAPAEVASDALPGQLENKIESSAKRLRRQQDAPLAVTVVPDLANEPAFAPSVVAPAPPASMAQSAPSSAVPVPDEGIRRSASSRVIDGAEIEASAARQQMPSSGSAPRGTVRQSTSAASRSDAAMAGTQIEEPKHWLERIRQLRKDGKAQDADREWQHFLAAYPDYAVAETDTARARP